MVADGSTGQLKAARAGAAQPPVTSAGDAQPPVTSAGTGHPRAATPGLRRRLQPEGRLRQRLAGMSLRARVRVLLLLGAVLLVAIVVACTASFVNLNDARNTLVNQIDPANIQADQLEIAYLNQETGVRGYVLSANTSFLQPAIAGMKQEAAAKAALARLLAGRPHLLALTQEVESKADRWWLTYAGPIVLEVAQHKMPAAANQEQLLISKGLFDSVRTSFARLDAALADAKASSTAQLDSATSSLIAVLVTAAVALVAAGALVVLALRRWVTEPLSHLAGDVRMVSAGDISHPITPRGPPEIAELGHDVEAMRRRTTDELAQVTLARAELADRNADLARSNQDLEQFAYVASHDLQEPLRKVTSFVQLLQSRYEGKLDERAEQYIGLAVDGSKRMLALINDLLAFSRVGRTTEQFERMAMEAAVAAALDNLQTTITETGAVVDVGPLPAVSGDLGLLTALWQNLVANSLKFRSNAPPHVAIEASRRPRETEWTFRVSDNGIGIETRFADKIFFIFQRLHPKEAYPGTGIGLALCKKIVEFHGGHIRLEPEHGPGTTIAFTLPVLIEPTTMRRPAPTTATRLEPS